MIIPIGDDNSKRVSFPAVTLTLIALNAIVFFLELHGGDEFLLRFAMFPSQVTSGSLDGFGSIFTAMFMHGGWAHLLGNMLYLYVFGDNVEDVLGKGRYLIFYLTCGVAGFAAQVAANPISNVPNLGASGAISGVLAAYLFLFPKNKVKVLIFFFVTNVSAWFVLGLWIATQILSGYGELSSQSSTMSGGIAYMAHIGGFVTGAILLFVLKPRSHQSLVGKSLPIEELSQSG